MLWYGCFPKSWRGRRTPRRLSEQEQTKIGSDSCAQGAQVAELASGLHSSHCSVLASLGDCRNVTFIQASSPQLLCRHFPKVLFRQQKRNCCSCILSHAPKGMKLGRWKHNVRDSRADCCALTSLWLVCVYMPPLTAVLGSGIVPCVKRQHFTVRSQSFWH